MTKSEDPSATAVLRRVAPGWAWLRENFKLPALLTIGGLLVGAGSFLLSEHLAIRELDHKLAGLRVPHALEQRVNTLELQQAALPERLNEFDRRIAAQEHEWQVVHDAAALRVPGVSRTARRANPPGR